MKLHDLHHVLTGYAADWTGESEIAAWEIGAGCGGHLAAWVLNLFAMQYGVFIAPRAVLAAFARGRRSQSLYAASELDERMLEERVEDARKRLGLDREIEPGVADVARLAAWWVAGLALWAWPIVLVSALVW
ncbi:hypothetical protein DB32_003506 [Sandaracinus amylolyticus]|uniref:Uncharacterized protein n=1 Tax=Sandaracinus amylolyticus TaxID=927083 RepID=A0A0F6YIN6_9BACT|nr:hypothetical protein DB32_003506 [Sandaracinus amylolyticus]